HACADALAAEGVDLVITGRDEGALAAAAARIGERHGTTVRIAPGDITTEAGRAAALAACPAPDILVNNAGGPPLGDWRTFTREQWLAAADSNMVAAILLTGAVIDGMAERGFGRVL